MKPNFNNCSEIKGLRFFTKEISPYYCCFLHTKKDSEGASIHRINELFPLKRSLNISLKIEYLPLYDLGHTSLLPFNTLKAKPIA